MHKDSTQPTRPRLKLPLTPLQRIVADLACMSAAAERDGRLTEAWRINRAVNELAPLAKRDEDPEAGAVVTA